MIEKQVTQKNASEIIKESGKIDAIIAQKRKWSEADVSAEIETGTESKKFKEHAESMNVTGESQAAKPL